MSPDLFLKLSELALSKEQMKGVIDVLKCLEEEHEAKVEKSKEKARARLQKWRDKPENVAKRFKTSPDVSKRLTGEDAGGEDNLQTRKQEGKKEEGAPAARSPKSTRLPEDWTVPASWLQEAIDAGLTMARALSEAKKMHNWSLSEKTKGVKLNWHATWQNWFARAVENDRPRSTAAPPGPPRNAGELSRLQLINGTAPHEPPNPDNGRVDPGDGRRETQGTGITRRFAVPADQFGRIAAGDVLRRT